ncbi:MAG: hypothetical protein ACTHK0_06995, partial [Ginsengibacter sp.]
MKNSTSAVRTHKKMPAFFTDFFGKKENLNTSEKTKLFWDPEWKQKAVNKEISGISLFKNNHLHPFRIDEYIPFFKSLTFNKAAMKSFLPPTNKDKFLCMKKTLLKSCLLTVAFLIASLFFINQTFGQTILYLKNTQTNPGTGGNVYDLSTTQGTGTLTVISGGNATTTLTEELAFTITNSPITANAFSVSINVSAASSNGNFNSQFRLQRVNSSGVVQASTNYSTQFSNTGIYSALLSFSTAQTWGATDRLRLSIEVARNTTGTTARTITVSVNNVNSIVSLITSPAIFNSSGIFPVPAGVTCMKVEAWGAGGNGGTGVAGGFTTGNGGAGGGSGAYVIQNAFATTPGGNLTITIGQGGGTTGSGTTPTANTSVGSIIAAGGNSASGTTAGAGGTTGNSAG